MTTSTPSCSARRKQYMIGNVIDSLFLVPARLPGGRRLLGDADAVIVVMVLVYVRRAGTEELL